MKRIKRLLTNKWLWLIVIVLVVGGGIFYYRQQQAAKPTYTTVTPEYRTLAQTVEVSGVIDAKEKATLRFPGSSRLSWVGVKEGDYVKKWQAIASVDTNTLEKQLQQDFFAFEKLWRTHDQTLDDVNYYSDAGLTDEFRRIAEQSSFDLQSSAINVEIRKLAINLSSLISPIDGLVVQIDQPFSGANISPTDTFQIVNPATIEFAAVIDEEDISLVQPTQKAELVIDAYPEETINALVDHVEFISSQSQSGGTGYGVTLLFTNDNQYLKYKLGMNGTATIIITQTENALSIPIDSLIVRDDQSFVDVLENEVVVRKEVTTGVEAEEYIQILTGLSINDQVVVPNGSEEDN